jgi:hypothetical protein
MSVLTELRQKRKRRDSLVVSIAYIYSTVITPMNQLSSEGSNLVRMQIHSDKVRIIDAVCINCNKRFKSMRAVSMHLKMTAARHTVNFINYGNYDKKTGLRELNRPEA